MSLTIHTKIDLGGVTRKVSPSNFTKGKYALANQVLMDSDQFVPMKSGALRASGHVESGGGSVSWNTVYARAHYYGTNGIVTFRKYTTPGTGKTWFKKAKKANIDKWKRTAVKEMGL